MKREIFLSAFFAFRKEKEIMYGKPFVGFSEILSTKNRGIFKYLIDNHSVL